MDQSEESQVPSKSDCSSKGNEYITSSESADSQEESSGWENTDDPGVKCLAMLKRASSDTEKFTALLAVTKVLKGNEINEKLGKKLLQAIGLNFIGRLLGTNDVPEGCPPFMFKSIALSVLSSFINTCYHDPSVHRLIPILVEIVNNCDLYEGDLALVKESYMCIDVLASHSIGRKALIDYEVLGSLVDTYVNENIYYEHAFEIIRKVAGDKENKIWEDEPEAFTRLMDHLCRDFADSQDEQKFFLCEALADVLPSMLNEFISLSNEGCWKPLLYKGLSDILFSKLDQSHRNKGMYLASVVLEILGTQYIINGEKGRQLFLLMVNFACIEVRMSLEDKSFEESISLAFQTTACYSIIEEAIKFLVNGAISLEEKQKQQLYAALKGAFNGVLEFLNGASFENEALSFNKNQMFICASVRVLGAWLAEETSANKEQVYQIIPFLIKVAKHNFDYNNPVSSSKKKKLPAPKNRLPDLVCFLLPGLCHLTAEDRPRQILLDNDIESFLYDYLLFQWDKALLNSSGLSDKSISPSNSDSLITLCNIFMNLVVQEAKRVKENLVYFRLMRFLFLKTSEASMNTRNLHLTGCMCTLGLMIFRHQYANVNIQKIELSICRFIQNTVRFLWDGFNVEESTDYATLVISSAYQEQWDDLVELWYLSMHTLTIILSNVPWIVSFLIESEWPQTIVETFILVKSGGMEVSVQNAYEDFLCSLIEASPATKELLLIKGAKDVAKNHQLVKLSKLL